MRMSRIVLEIVMLNAIGRYKIVLTLAGLSSSESVPAGGGPAGPFKSAWI